MNKTNEYQIRPYARLLTMLGDQLISNEQVALVELVKNSYDADASWVKISFNNFEEIHDENGKLTDIKNTEKSSITIEDDGCGMTRDIIEKHWLNPATPEKANRKKNNPYTKKGRIIQGEKGIGRFALLKLGKKINITTRPEENEHNSEFEIDYDFSMFDEDFTTSDLKNLMLDELSIHVSEHEPKHFISRYISWGLALRGVLEQGTKIEISSLKGEWNLKHIKDISKDISRLQSIFDNNEENKLFIENQHSNNGFQIKIYINDTQNSEIEDPRQRLNGLLENNSVYKITKGRFDVKSKKYTFFINNSPYSIDLYDSRITGYKIFKDYFGKSNEEIDKHKLTCGSFEFEFYIFDFTAKPGTDHYLAKEEKELIKEHRVYLYRDGIRVYPYGNKEDDWLQIDMFRGTISAGMFLSNDQVVGCIKISQKENPHLRDKTNREGLIQDGTSTSDFIKLIQILLLFIRIEFFGKQYREKNKLKREQDIVKQKEVTSSFDALRELITENKQAVESLDNIEKIYKKEISYLHKRVDTTEELAGVGLSVETASHDIMAFMSKMLKNLDALIMDISLQDEINKELLLKELEAIRGSAGFIEAQLRDIQLLFKSSKQQRRQLKVKDLLDKVAYIYRRIIKKENISLNIITVGPPLMAKTTEAVLLQLFINLIDNSIYWLQPMNIPDKKIEVFLDGEQCLMVFSDNGPGVRKDDAPYIFEPFYSGKGEDGRGLGLYIARQLLERHAYSIELADIPEYKRLPGANFVISFIASEEV